MALEVDPLFEVLFVPFVNVLVDKQLPVRLGVCEECGSVYVLKAHDVQGRTCDAHCKRRVEAQRRANPEYHPAIP